MNEQTKEKRDMRREFTSKYVLRITCLPRVRSCPVGVGKSLHNREGTQGTSVPGKSKNTKARDVLYP